MVSLVNTNAPRSFFDAGLLFIIPEQFAMHSA